LLKLFYLHPIHTLFPYTTLFRSMFLSNLKNTEMAATTRPINLDRNRNEPHPRLVPPASTPDLLSLPEAPASTSPSRSATSCCARSEEHTSELQSLAYLVCRLLLE